MGAADRAADRRAAVSTGGPQAGALRRPEDRRLREGGEAPVGRRQAGRERGGRVDFLFRFSGVKVLVHFILEDNTKPRSFDFFLTPPFSLLFFSPSLKKWERK
ncbi:hypothetical protein NN561_014395 [Cricetulus griseus]